MKVQHWRNAYKDLTQDRRHYWYFIYYKNTIKARPACRALFEIMMANAKSFCMFVFMQRINILFQALTFLNVKSLFLGKCGRYLCLASGNCIGVTGGYSSK